LPDVQQAGEYLQLPKPLVTRVAQHAAARTLRCASTSPAALPAALQRGAFASLVDACLKAIQPLIIALGQGLKFPPEAEALRGVYEYIPCSETAALEQQALLAHPSFLQGLCGAALSGCSKRADGSHHLAGVLRAGHPLPARLHVSKVAVAAAVAVGHAAALKRLTAPSSAAALSAAAYFGRTDMLDWLIGEASQAPEKQEALHYAVDCAAAAGRLATLQRLLFCKGRFSKSTAAAAASGSHLHLLQFLRSAGCPWDSDTLVQAAAGGHREALQWAIAGAAQWMPEIALRRPAQATCCFCNGCESRGSRGMCAATLPLPRAGIWTSCASSAKTAATGALVALCVKLPHLGAAWSSCSAASRPARAGICALAKLQQPGAIETSSCTGTRMVTAAK
jgi:hypothetical protein